MALPHVAPGEKVNLQSNTEGNFRTAALVKTDGFEVAKLVLRAGDNIALHSVSGHATVQCLQGRALIEMPEPIEVGPGDWLYLDRGQKHSVRSIEDCVLLLTILFD